MEKIQIYVTDKCRAALRKRAKDKGTTISGYIELLVQRDNEKENSNESL